MDSSSARCSSAQARPLAGAWAKNTRYQMTVGFINPDRGDRPPTIPFPSMWMLPLTVSQVGVDDVILRRSKDCLLPALPCQGTYFIVAGCSRGASLWRLRAALL